MTRLELFKETLAQVNKLQNPIWRSISVQLNYLIDLQEGRRSDRERLNDIIIGVQTVREIEPDDILAPLLYRVCEEVQSMKDNFPTT